MVDKYTAGEDKFKMKCQNPNCGFMWDTYAPERQANKVCQRCGGMTIKKDKVNK